MSTYKDLPEPLRALHEMLESIPATERQENIGKHCLGFFIWNQGISEEFDKAMKGGANRVSLTILAVEEYERLLYGVLEGGR